MAKSQAGGKPQQFARNVRVIRDEDAGKKTHPGVSAALKSYKDLHSGRSASPVVGKIKKR